MSPERLKNATGTIQQKSEDQGSALFLLLQGGEELQLSVRDAVVAVADGAAVIQAKDTHVDRAPADGLLAEVGRRVAGGGEVAHVHPGVARLPDGIQGGLHVAVSRWQLCHGAGVAEEDP